MKFVHLHHTHAAMIHHHHHFSLYEDVRAEAC
jgi:hypothetical protein